MSDDFDKLVHVDDGSQEFGKEDNLEKDLQAKRELVKKIVESLIRKCNDFDPEETIKLIVEYREKWERISYADVTLCVYAMTEEKGADFTLNLQRLLEYTTKHKDIDSNVVKAIYKLFDHAHLAIYQSSNVKDLLLVNAEKIQKELYDKIYAKLHKESEDLTRNYITILGIFASIVASFFAGLAFSASVLQNMHNVSIYRLVLVILLLGFILGNVINILVLYVFKLNDKFTYKFPIKGYNDYIFIMLCILMFAWYVQIDKFHF